MSRLGALIGAALGLAACALAPAPPGPAAAPGLPDAPGPGPAVSGPGEAASGASGAAEPASGLRPHRGALFDSDAEQRFQERALLQVPRLLQLKRGEPAAIEGGPGRFLPPRQVTVVQTPGLPAPTGPGPTVRIRFDAAGVRLLFWAPDEALELSPVQPQRLALRPGVYPVAPAGLPGGERIGAWLVPGRYIEPLRRKEGWREVEFVDQVLTIRGWLDEAEMGRVFVPQRVPTETEHARVLQGAFLLASPGGSPVARVNLEAGEIPQWSPWFGEVGPAPAGYKHVLHRGDFSWVQGLVAAAVFQPPELHRGYGRGGSISHLVSSGPKIPPLRWQIEAGTPLYDGPAGEQIGLVTAVLGLPDRIEARESQGRRQVEVPVRGLGMVRAWVDGASLKPYVASPAASASGSSSARPPVVPAVSPGASPQNDRR